MRSILSVRLAVVAIVLALAAPAAAQEFRGRVNGVVRDNTGAVLPGVTVTATSPALIQPQAVVTDQDGTYRLIALPPGVYTLTFELSGFKTLRREGIRVVINTTLPVDAAMEIATLEETVTVTGESPVVDASTTRIGTNFTKELLTEIPNARDVWAAMSQAPGFQMTGFDVGGSHTGTQTGYVTYGIAQQRTTRIEGINTTENVDANAGYFDFGSFEEFQLGGAGNMADQDTPGASLNITVKSGGDQFHGTWYSDWEGKGSISNNVPAELEATGGVKDGFKAPPGGVQRGNKIDRQYDLNGTVGGPVYKGKAWFFFSWRLNNQYKFITGMSDLAQSKLTNYTIKGTYQLTKNNQLIGYWNGRSKLQPLRELGTTRPPSTAYYQASNNYPFKGEWTSVLSDKMFLDVIVGDWRNFFPLRPTWEGGSWSGTAVPGRIELTTSQYLDGGAMDYYQKYRRYKPQYNASMNYYKQGWKGDHDFKFGAEGRWEKFMFLQDEPFDLFYRDRNGLPAELDLYNTPNDGDNRTTAQAIFAQDTWKFSQKVTVNLGVRYDHYKDFYPDQTITPNGIPALKGDTDPTRATFFATKTVQGQTVSTSNTFGPRLGFAYDLKGNGKTVIKGYFGQFYFNTSPDILAQTENPVGTAQLRYRFLDCRDSAGQPVVCTATTTPGNRVLDGPQELGTLLSTQGGAGFVKIDRSIKRPYSQEASGHVEQEVAAGLSARASFVYKNIRNDWAEVDLTRVNAYTVPLTRTDPGPDGVTGTADDQAITVYDIPAGTGSNRVYTNPTDPAYKSDFKTFEVTLNRRFQGRWMALTSFGYTWLHQFYAVTSTTNSLDSAGLGKAYNWRPNQRRTGENGNGREKGTLYNFKLIGRYVFPYEIGFSASYKFQSGRNWGRSLSVALPNAGSETIRVETANAQRAPNVGIFDIRVDKAFKAGKAGTLSGMLDIFNLTNSGAVTNFRITTGSRYKEIIALLDPRIVRVGVRWDF